MNFSTHAYTFGLLMFKYLHILINRVQNNFKITLILVLH
jgi:hypothetical protein